MDEINEFLFGLIVSTECGWEYACGSKIIHDDPEEARKHADKLNARPGRRESEPYPCPWCWSWHVGRKLNRSQIIYLVNRMKRRHGWLDDA